MLYIYKCYIMFCVSVSNFSIYVYPNKTFIVARTLWRFRHYLSLSFSGSSGLLTLITTKTIFASSTHPSSRVAPSFNFEVVICLDHGQTLLHIHHLVLRRRRAWCKCLHVKRMRMLVLLVRRRSPSKQR